ncbi:MAG: hypothetical protein U0T73_11045 [Chitinophagales bacterium]
MKTFPSKENANTEQATPVKKVTRKSEKQIKPKEKNPQREREKKELNSENLERDPVKRR